MAVRPIPEGYHTVTPYLVVEGADALIGFLREAFGAEELHRMERPEGGIVHAEVRVGDSRVMLSDATAEWPAQPGLLHLYVEDVDSTYARALEAGATSVMEPANQFYGDRHGGVRDLTGNQWWISTHVEDVPAEEMERRMAEQMTAPAAGTEPADAV